MSIRGFLRFVLTTAFGLSLRLWHWLLPPPTPRLVFRCRVCYDRFKGINPCPEEGCPYA